MRTCVGYTGGTTKDPTYHLLGDHTETLQVEFDPAVVGYADLLAIFWAEHDPAARPWSAQYKAAVFVHDDAQRRLAEATRDAWARAHPGRPVRTEVATAGVFYPAEDDHQKWQLRRDEALAAELLAVYADPVAFRDSTAAARLNAYLGGHGTTAQLEAELPLLGLSPAGAAALRERVTASERRGPPVGCR